MFGDHAQVANLLLLVHDGACDSDAISTCKSVHGASLCLSRGSKQSEATPAVCLRGWDGGV